MAAEIKKLPSPDTQQADVAHAKHDDHDDHGGTPHDLQAPPTGRVVMVVSVFAVLLLALFLTGLIPSMREQRETRKDADERANAKPVVQWTHPKKSTGEKDVRLPCDLQANQQTAIYPRTTGYLKDWMFDLGQHVEKDQLLAVISAPEVDAQLTQSEAAEKQSEANVAKSEADLHLAQTTYQRYVDAQKTNPGSVTQEDVDTRKSNLENAEAAVKQAKANVDAAVANVKQLQTNVDFQKLYAPFSGTITARKYDRGQLLLANVSSPGTELFDLAQTDLLRAFVNVPQVYANSIKIGQTAKLEIRNFPGKQFEGQITFTAGAVDPNTRTLRVQVDFKNPNNELYAGAYGVLLLPVTPQAEVEIIPSSALLFNAKGLSVSVVGDDSKAHVRDVKLGRDLGTELEVTEGLSPADKVITNPSARSGEGTVIDPHEQPTAPGPVPKAGSTTRPA